MEALIVVDLQEATVARGGLHDLSGTIERIKRLGQHVRERGGTVVHVKHDGEPGEELEPFRPGWHVARRLEPQAADPRVRKRLNDPFQGTELESLLGELGKRRLIIAGWATDFCVDATVRSAVARGFEVVVAGDCHTLADREHLGAEQVIEHHNWVWANLIAPAGIRVRSEREIRAD